MKNLLKVSSVLLGLSGVFASSIAHAAAPTVSIDFPAANQVVSGIMSVNGWAAGNPQVDEVVLYVDGKYYGNVGHGGSRDDVKNAMPTTPNAALSGFSVAVNTRLMTNGAHTLEIRAFNGNNEVSSQSVAVSVSNAPGQENPSSVGLNMAGAKARVLAGNKLVVEGAKVNGVSHSLVLEFNAGTNNFVISSFAHDTNGDGIPDQTNCTNDKDCDGVDDGDDAFPNDATETGDSDHNGVGDNKDNETVHNGSNETVHNGSNETVHNGSNETNETNG